MVAYLSEDNGNANKYLYNDKELNDDHNLYWYHYGARYYDPQLGRWMQVDPADEFYSPYVYCMNSPIIVLDPDGKDAKVVLTNIASGTYTAESGETVTTVNTYYAFVFIDGKYVETLDYTRDPYNCLKDQGEGLYGDYKETPPGTYYLSLHRLGSNRIDLGDYPNGHIIQGPDGIRDWIQLHLAKSSAEGCMTSEEHGRLLEIINAHLTNNVNDDTTLTIIDRHNIFSAFAQYHEIVFNLIKELIHSSSKEEN
ncbi:MAG: RHS repeat-associated core domain-containing protein [Candidatus Lokiarchaeota archaeon]|nr:RHS repeat-associated core domain-containing protein [Candidatus Lokiarchaeota archaeon]